MLLQRPGRLCTPNRQRSRGGGQYGEWCTHTHATQHRDASFPSPLPHPACQPHNVQTSHTVQHRAPRTIHHPHTSFTCIGTDRVPCELLLPPGHVRPWRTTAAIHTPRPSHCHPHQPHTPHTTTTTPHTHPTPAASRATPKVLSRPTLRGVCVRHGSRSRPSCRCPRPPSPLCCPLPRATRARAAGAHTGAMAALFGPPARPPAPSHHRMRIKERGVRR